MPQPIVETATLAGLPTTTGGRRLIQLISPGWGSSGYYSPAVLEQAVTDGLFPAGMHMYADHATEAEAIERPGRSVKDLMAVSRTPGRLATDEETQVDGGPDVGAIVAEVEVVPAWRDLIDTVSADIGVSISGDATDITVGEAEGRSGRIIEGLAHVASVDFVTRAGRGGRILHVLESAAANRRALRHGISEATVNDTREQLQTVLRDAYASEKSWVYVRDFDDTTVWFEVDGEGDANGIYAQTYTNSADVVALTGDRTEVRVVTTYVPVSPTAGQDAAVTRPGDNTTEESTEEDPMGKIQIEEAEHTRLVETAGRVDTLTSERDTALAERDQAAAERDSERRRNRAMDIVREHDHAFTPLEAKGLVADLPLTESGDLDEDAFTGQLAEHAAAAAKAGGAGRVSGMGAATDTGSVAESANHKRTTSAWGRALTEKGA